ncbi:hypothetical protein [Ascidiaceihabitans sp.]|uniref:hypothetical protein n=1 Tax=Ascidiaceihabitans sp. TaxID=1872644 RepID=UPI003299B533
MSDIEELQRRITAAMDRVAVGLDGLGTDTGADTTELEQALEDEKTVNAQLSERIRALTQRQDADLAAAKAQADIVTGRLTEMDTELQRLRSANNALRQSNEDLRQANEAGVGDAHLINKAMMAELEGLRATRAADVSEMNTIIDTLTPLIQTENQTPSEPQTPSEEDA